MPEKDEVKMTKDMIDGFLAEMDREGRCRSSLRSYRQVLTGLYRYLQPEGGVLSRTSMLGWYDWLQKQGFSRRTINARTSILNSFLKYIGKREWLKTDFYEKGEELQPELSRTEYMRLLKTARNLGKQREYLLIKVLGSLGVRTQELGCITVEAVREGRAEPESYNQKRVLYIPTAMQKELLDYAAEEGIRTGPILQTQEGGLMSRSTMWYMVSSVGREAGLDEGKANPRCLWRMYCNTYEGIRSSIMVLVERAYERIINEEQLVIGWEK